MRHFSTVYKEEVSVSFLLEKMEEEDVRCQLAVSHLLQQTLRSLCTHQNSQWVYAVFWRILPRNYPPPKWDGQGGYDCRSRGNRRNWILVWEDGFCNFAASSSSSSNSAAEFQHYGLQPDLFFKMSHEIYNYGEGLMGKVAADHSHKWIYKPPNDQEINFLSAWHNSADSHPRTWEAQFQSGIKTIALIALREGLLQLGAVDKVVEDLSYVVMLRKKMSYIESIPGVLLPHPSSAGTQQESTWNHQQQQMYHHQFINPLIVTPSMSSLEALLSKLPSVLPPVPPPSGGYYEPMASVDHHADDKVIITKKENVDDDDDDDDYYRAVQYDDVATTSTTSISGYYQPNYNLHEEDRYGSCNGF